MRRAYGSYLGALVCLALAGRALAATYHVSPSGSDSNPGTPGAPFLTIQKGLDSALAGDTVSVASGTYLLTQSVVLSTSGVSLVGAGWTNTFIDGGGTWGGGTGGDTAAVWVQQDVTGVLITGFTISNRFHGVFLDYDSDAVVEYNRISGNFLNNVTANDTNSVVRYNLIEGSSPLSIYHSFSGVDVWDEGSARVHNNTIVAVSEIGICYLSSTTPIIFNNIIVDSPQGIGSPSSSGLADIRYNLIWKNDQNFDAYTKNQTGKNGNIAADPVFVDQAGGDFRLRSCSPAIDAGDPAAQYDDPDGSRNDMGAFPRPGGQASLKPPSQLSAVPVSGSRVSLTWLLSPSAETTQYRLYYTTASALDYVTPKAVIAHPGTSYLTPPLTPGLLYRFGLRASDGVCEEANNTVVAFATPGDAEVRAVIKIPKTGHKVNGNSLTVMAELVEGTPSQTRDVLFQYRRAEPDEPDQAWLDIPAANVNQPNPDPTSPYFTHWDVTALPFGYYQLRALATSAGGAPDPAPPSITIFVTTDDPDQVENDDSLGHHQQEKVYNTIGNTVTVGSDAADSLTQVLLPAGSLSRSVDTLSVITTPLGIAGLSAPEGFVNLVSYRLIELSPGGQLAGPALITMGYPDADRDGLVDGLAVSAYNLELMNYSPGTGVWTKVSRAASVSPAAGTASFWTPHFSVFGLFVPTAADLSAVEVFPVPFVPNDGDDDNGKPFNASDGTSGIVFNQLTGSVKLEVFTVTGQLVWRRETGLSGSRVQWDARTLDGRDAASGVYFAVITSGSGQKILRKLAIIR